MTDSGHVYDTSFTFTHHQHTWHLPATTLCLKKYANFEMVQLTKSW